jgi:hypothetical protein
MKQLGAMDASFLYLETPETPMHVGGLSLFELPQGYAGNFHQDFKEHFARRIHLVPILSKKLVPMPFDIDHPVWVDDHAVDLDYHIRHVTLSKPGTLRQLETLVGRLRLSRATWANGWRAAVQLRAAQPALSCSEPPCSISRASRCASCGRCPMH